MRSWWKQRRKKDVERCHRYWWSQKRNASKSEGFWKRIYIYIDYISFWNYYGDFWCACFFFVFGGCSWAGWEYYFSNILQLLIHCLNRVIMQVGTFPPTVSLMPAPFVLEELELMTAQLFDGQQVQQAVQKALTSLEATVCGFFRWPWSWKYFRCCSWLQEPLHLTWPMTKL